MTALLRVVSILFAVFAVGHTFGAVATPSRGPAEDSVFSAMRQFTFPVMGVERTHWLFYRGFALFLSVNLFVLVVWVWQLGRLAARQPQEARPFVVTLFIGSVGFALLSWWYFFPAPAAVSTAAAALLGIAVAGSQRAASDRIR